MGPVPRSRKTSLILIRSLQERLVAEGAGSSWVPMPDTDSPLSTK